ncbi:serine/threonine-protein kinase Nek7-like [Saccostrea echinata]|uniref:serine/threonine-protein kinase Nek7-like n=1 Tax=Saccostrea echinata TaxID=191078 RepID=UPI002A818C13|nr:serine/threonine-protein kinase Nek7-like [Saccostrea echinata]
MSIEPEPKKRKMEPHIGGDNGTIQNDSSKSAHNLASQSASGDFGADDLHQYVMALPGDEGVSNPANYKIIRQGCALGDEWVQTYPPPLSSYPARSIKTGNSFYDSFVHNISKLAGLRPLRTLARGRSGAIILAQDLHKTNHYKQSEYIPVVLKLNSSKPRRKPKIPVKTDMDEEMRIFKELNHCNIVSWISNISYHGRIGIVMEFCENGNLEQLLRLHDARFLTEPVCRRYFRNIFDAVEYIHLQNIAHRDICTQNIFITSHNTLKLGDFGHAVYFFTGDQLFEDECGTIGFQAPEIVNKQAYNPKYADIWSLGCTLYLMSTGRLPLGVIPDQIKERAPKEIQFPEKRVLDISQPLREIVRGALAFNPGLRFTLNRIKHCDWIKDSCSKVQIGNFHIIRQPRKIREGEVEQALKKRYEI